MDPEKRKVARESSTYKRKGSSDQRTLSYARFGRLIQTELVT